MGVDAPHPYGGVYKNCRPNSHAGWTLLRNSAGKFLYRHEPVGLVHRWVLADRVATQSKPDLDSGFYVLAAQGPLPIGEHAWKSLSFKEQAITTALLVRLPPPTHLGWRSRWLLRRTRMRTSNRR